MSGGLLTLAIEASTYTGSVSLSRGTELLAHAEVAMRGREEERLMPAVADVLERGGASGAAGGDVERIVCGAGPGSFTSLRIAGAIAKGLATAWRRPLVPVSSLAFLAASLDRPLEPGPALVAMDALRDEYYLAECMLGADGEVLAIAEARVVPAAAVRQSGMRVIGTGFDHEAVPRASAIVRLQHLLAESHAADLGGWEPVYGRLAEAQARWEAAHGRALTHG